MPESILTRPRTKKVWSPKIGGNDLESRLGGSSHLQVWNGTRAVLRTRTQTAVFTYRYGMERARFCVLEPRPQCTGSCNISTLLAVTKQPALLLEYR